MAPGRRSTRWAKAGGGIRVAYETAGRGEPAMVFVHGWCCDRSYFAPQVAFFGKRQRVVTLDLRGHGESDRPDAAPGVYDIGAFVDDVLAVARDGDLGRPIVVGHSLGGLVALACAGRPESVRAAVAISPALTLDPATKAFFARSVGPIAGDVNGAWRAAFVERELLLPTDTVRRAEIVSGIAAVPPGIAAAAWKAMEEFDGAAALQEVRVPVLAIESGSEPRLSGGHGGPIAVGRTVGAGHFHQLEVPDQVNSMIERFLRLPTSAAAPSRDALHRDAIPRKRE